MRNIITASSSEENINNAYLNLANDKDIYNLAIKHFKNIKHNSVNIINPIKIYCSKPNFLSKEFTAFVKNNFINIIYEKLPKDKLAIVKKNYKTIFVPEFITHFDEADINNGFDINNVINNDKNFNTIMQNRIAEIFIKPIINGIINGEDSNIDINNYDGTMNYVTNVLDESMNDAINSDILIKEYLENQFGINNGDNKKKVNEIISLYFPKYQSATEQAFIINMQGMLNLVADSLFKTNNISFNNAEIGDTFVYNGNFYEDPTKREGCFLIVDGHYKCGENPTYHAELLRLLEEEEGIIFDNNMPYSMGYVMRDKGVLCAIINMQRTNKYSFNDVKNILSENSFFGDKFSKYFTTNEICTTKTSVRRKARLLRLSAEDINDILGKSNNDFLTAIINYAKQNTNWMNQSDVRNKVKNKLDQVFQTINFNNINVNDLQILVEPLSNDADLKQKQGFIKLQKFLANKNGTNQQDATTHLAQQYGISKDVLKDLFTKSPHLQEDLLKLHPM